MKWQPIIEPGKDNGFREKLDEIAAVLLKEAPGMERMGLAQGKAGVALFFFYYAEFTGEEIYYDAAIDLVSGAVDSMGTLSQHTLAKGETGIGWVLGHLVENKFIDFETGSITADLDRFICEHMKIKLDLGIYDLLNGAVGDGVYLLGRFQREHNDECLVRLMDGLENISIRPANGGFAWKSIVYDLEHKPTGINLGLLYGIAGVIVFLSKLVEKGIYKEKAVKLLEGTVKFLLGNAIPPGKSPYSFPGWAGDYRDFSTCGLSLGYGDLSTALTLWHAAIAIGNREWRQIALETLRQTTGLTGLNEHRVMDASLTVGTSGISHLYNRMYHYTGEDVFLKSSRYWLNRTLELAKEPAGFAGFLAWRSEKSKHKDKDFALSEGIAGIGLVLISALSSVEPLWDRCLLLS